MKYHLFTFSLFIIYLVAVTALMIWQGIGIAPDRYIFLIFLLSLFLKKGRRFLLDWFPFFFLLISYDFLRGLVPLLNSNVHFIELIQTEQFIFKTIPSKYLQDLFWNPASPSFYDYLATVIYFLHFVPPFIFGFLLWTRNRSYFRQFTLGVLLLSYAAWATFLIYPASPPWLSAQKGYLPGVVKIMDTTMNIFPEKVSLPTVYHQIHPNKVAALPSLHAAYPLLILLFAYQFFKKKSLFFLPYILGVWISIVYLGEHFVIDIILGAIYALSSFLVARWAFTSVKFPYIWLKKATVKSLT